MYNIAKNDLIGLKFGRLTAIKIKGRVKSGATWLCKCDCGGTKIVPRPMLISKITMSCGCLKKDSLEFLASSRKLPLGEKPKRDLLAAYKASAKKRKLPFSLTMDEFERLTKQNCFYCEMEPKLIRKNTRHKRLPRLRDDTYIYNGIDRVDNTIGYTIKNTVTCCKMCNYSKNKNTQKYFIDWIETAYKNLKRNGHYD